MLLHEGGIDLIEDQYHQVNVFIERERARCCRLCVEMPSREMFR
jgi:hypothetical protein